MFIREDFFNLEETCLEVFSGNFEFFCLQRKVIENTQKINCKTNICIDQKTSKEVFSMKITSKEVIFFVEQIWKIKYSSWFYTFNSWDDLHGLSNHPKLHHNSYLLVNHQESLAYEPYIICNQNLQFFFDEFWEKV